MCGYDFSSATLIICFKLRLSVSASVFLHAFHSLLNIIITTITLVADMKQYQSIKNVEESERESHESLHCLLLLYSRISRHFHLYIHLAGSGMHVRTVHKKHLDHHLISMPCGPCMHKNESPLSKNSDCRAWEGTCKGLSKRESKAAVNSLPWTCIRSIGQK